MASLPGGTAGAPDANSRACSLAREKPRDDLFLNLLENLGIPEETGDADEEFAKERVPFAPGELHIAEIVFQPIDLVDGHTPLDAAYDGAPFVLGKVMTGLGAEQDKDLFQPVSRLRHLRGYRKEGSPKRMRDVGEELSGHLVWRQHKIHHAGSDGAAGHAIVLGGFGCLGHHHAALALHRPDAERPVATSAGEHNTDGALVVVLGQGAEEKIDGEPDAAGQGRLQQL